MRCLDIETYLVSGSTTSPQRAWYIGLSLVPGEGRCAWCEPLAGPSKQTYVRGVPERSKLTEERLASLYGGEGFGGETTMRARVIRELIDEIRALRCRLDQASGR